MLDSVFAWVHDANSYRVKRMSETLATSRHLHVDYTLLIVVYHSEDFDWQLTTSAYDTFVWWIFKIHITFECTNQTVLKFTMQMEPFSLRWTPTKPCIKCFCIHTISLHIYRKQKLDFHSERYVSLNTQTYPVFDYISI